MRSWNLTQSDCTEIHNLLLNWMYVKRYGSGESPASERQVNLIEKLGGVAALGMNKKEASRLINILKEQR